MQVIGLTGVAGAGKSTVAQYLVEKHGFTRLSFAAPLKQMLRTLDPLLRYDAGFVSERLSDILHAYDWDENAVKASGYGKEYRRLLQVLGTDCIRAVDPDFWVKAALAQMADPKGKYVFDDVRFPNEAEVIKGYSEWGLWWVQRPGYLGVNGHESEKHAGNMGELMGIANIDARGLNFLYKNVDTALDVMHDEMVRKTPIEAP